MVLKKLVAQQSSFRYEHLICIYIYIYFFKIDIMVYPQFVHLGDNCNFKLRQYQSQFEFSCDALAYPVNRYLRLSNQQLMPSELKIQYYHIHSNETYRKQCQIIHLKSIKRRLCLHVCFHCIIDVMTIGDII